MLRRALSLQRHASWTSGASVCCGCVESQPIADAHLVVHVEFEGKSEQEAHLAVREGRISLRKLLLVRLVE
jgi:hypothetical protein